VGDLLVYLFSLPDRRHPTRVEVRIAALLAIRADAYVDDVLAAQGKHRTTTPRFFPQRTATP
jgi:hypothetical protein